MSINEAPYPHTGLTPAEQRDATSAIYGPAPGTLPLDPNNLNPQTVEALEALVAQYRQQNAPVAAEFDLNKPPLRPYRFQPFPKMIYHHERRTYQIVQNQAQLDYNLARGWKTEPYPSEVTADEMAPALTEADEREAAYFDAELKRKPPKK
jgi:hypothetical protein